MRWSSLFPAALVVVAFVAAPATVRAADEDAALPTDPTLVTGTLENGLAYIVQQHGNPKGHVSIWMHVSSGSLNETEEQRGIAHFLEHMAFNGSENFPAGTVVKFFESLGLSFGRDQNAFTSYDQTTYQLDLPDTTDEMLDRGMLFMSDVAFRLSLAETEIDSERGIILEEKRARSGVQQRIREQIMPALLPGSRVADRNPIGTDDTLMAVQKPDFDAYYSKFYVPANVTVIVVGDTEPERMVAAVKRGFGEAPKAELPADADPGITFPTGPRAIVITDPELRMAQISMTRLDPPRPASTPRSGYRRDLVEYLGSWIFNRRLSTAVAEGRAPFLQAVAGGGDVFRAWHQVEARAAGLPARWQEMLDFLALELQRARLHGFTEQELGDANTALAAQLEQAVATESTRPARAVLGNLNRAIESGDPVMSAEQERDLVAELTAGVDVAEVSAAFALNARLENPTFTLTMPEGEGVPTEEELVAAGVKALDQKPEATATAERAKALLEKIPEPGKIVDESTHEAAGVYSAWTENGVRLHHRFMDDQKGRATIMIMLAGGELTETAKTRGITQAATLAFDRPATSTLSSTQIRDLTTGKSVGVGGGAQTDGVTLTVSGAPADLETGMQVAYLLLTDPVIEPVALTQWKEAQEQAISGRKVSPDGVTSEAFSEAFYPAGEVRTHPLELENVQAVTLEGAQARLRDVIASPMEVSVVGDISLDDAKKLVATYLGSLPRRDRISSHMFADLRKLERPKGPIRVERTVETKTPQAMVLDGFYSVDRDNLPDLRAMFLASRILSTRMITTIREEKRLVYSIGAGSSPAAVFPGFGMFAAQAPTDPAKGAALADALDETWKTFAESGPTEEELKDARAQMANMLTESFKQPRFWIQRLATLDYQDQNLDDVMEMEAAYQSIPAEQIRETFARYCKPENRFTVIVTPAAAPTDK